MSMALVPNRVRGYELVGGEMKNAPFIDVSSRFGGGGLTGTVPDLLRWARVALSREDRLGEVDRRDAQALRVEVGALHGARRRRRRTTRSAGWCSPSTAASAIFAGGSQKGTETLLYYFPEKRLGIAVACNLQFAPTGRYVSRLYEL